MSYKRYFIKKIHLLFISIEILNLYSINYRNYNKITNTNILINNNKKYKYKFIKLLQDIIQIISIYALIKNNTIQELAYHILNEYNNKRKGLIISKYTNKFTYIYNKIYKKYSSQNQYLILNINEIAILNLYIIIKIYQKKGIFVFIKYLYYINI